MGARALSGGAFERTVREEQWWGWGMGGWWPGVVPLCEIFSICINRAMHRCFWDAESDTTSIGPKLSGVLSKAEAGAT